MILKPFDPSPPKTLIEEPAAPASAELVEAEESARINNALILAGIKPEPKEDNSLNQISEESARIRKIFKRHGAGVEEAARTVADLMRTAEAETTKLRATELALKVQGVFDDDKNKSQTPNVTINIIGGGNQTLLNLVVPTK